MTVTTIKHGCVYLKKNPRHLDTCKLYYDERQIPVSVVLIEIKYINICCIKSRPSTGKAMIGTFPSRANNQMNKTY